MIALTTKHQPKRIADFAGLKRAKAIMSHVVANPRPDAFLLHGAAGSGKTTMALALCEELNGQLIHIPSSECSVDKVRWLRDVTASYPMFGDWYVVVCDECDKMSPAAQVAFLSLLDATGMPQNTVFVFTCNATKGLEDRFISRCKAIEFPACTGPEVSNFLFGVWVKETGSFEAPPMRELIEASAGNIRGALNALEMELICQAVAA